MTLEERPTDDLPSPVMGPRRGISFIWIIPIVALFVALYLVYDSNSDIGQTITITFLTGEGLKAGDTKIMHNSVEIGSVDRVDLSSDLKTVTVTATMKKIADRYLRGATFWVVRPRISLSNISGIASVLSDKYIEMDAGSGEGGEPSLLCQYAAFLRDTRACIAREDTYKGLEEPPAVRAGVPGTEIVLDAARLGSVEPGTPLYFHGEVIGEVLSKDFDKAKERFLIRAQVNEDYASILHKGSRFYNDSGFTASGGISGFTFEFESLPALLSGAIAFENPPDADEDMLKPPSVDRNNPTHYTLFANRKAALDATYAQRVPFVVEFDGSVHGLEVDAPVEFRGIKVGNVTKIDLQYLPPTPTTSSRVRIPVTIDFEPQRVLRAVINPDGSQKFRSAIEQSNPKIVVGALTGMVADGLRAELQSSSLISSDLYVSFDTFPEDKAPPAKLPCFDNSDQAGGACDLPELPSRASSNLVATVSALGQKMSAILDHVQGDQVEGVIHDMREMLQAGQKLAQMPEIREALAAFANTLKSADTLIDSANTGYGNNSDVRRQLVETLRQFQDTAKSFKALADTIEEHPESIIRGKGMLP
jgi:paraquat-inducible protein B